ncbi:MAG: aldose epimerase family protein [Phaeovulum sp.]|uniref:aldose epimerase family protein n=1 Tax=Phaeovulum sp. TaxID=2934796 RepID=UPI00272FCC32|nr:aldose epimerase family protein [Phaeovulum sp.]MDP2061929.1 aldose epimerase family protein [Phaeovulum sp.]
MKPYPFGTMRDGREVAVITLSAGGLRARVLTLGAILADLRLDGADWPLVLGSDEIGAYEGPMAWFGAVVGPVANRISGARAELAGRELRFEANEGQNTLHGGGSGTSAQVWTVEDLATDRVTLSLRLAAGLGGFPGNRRISAEYRLSAPATLTLTLTATTDAPTLMNLAHHPYWNLDGSGTTTAHHLSVAADAYLPTNAACLPTGMRQPLGGDARDLRQARSLAGLPPLDHCFLLAEASRALSPVASLRGTRGISLQLATTAPGLQVYDGAKLASAPWKGHGGAEYGPHCGLALEPQLWPDAPAHPDFPSVRLDPGARFHQQTRYHLTLDQEKP